MFFKNVISCMSERDNRPYSIAGDRYLKEYRLIIDETGAEVLKPHGKTCIYDLIQAERESTDIRNIYSKFVNGDTNAFNRVRGMFVDARNLPTSYADLVNRIREAEDAFIRLPYDVKDKFHNNPSEFWSQFGTESFNAKFEELAKNSHLKDVADYVKEVSVNE